MAQEDALCAEPTSTQNEAQEVCQSCSDKALEEAPGCGSPLNQPPLSALVHEIEVGIGVDHVGLGFSSMPPKPLTISKVKPGTWADAAGLGEKIGEEVFEINGELVQDMTAGGLKDAMLLRPLRIKIRPIASSSDNHAPVQDVATEPGANAEDSTGGQHQDGHDPHLWQDCELPEADEGTGAAAHQSDVRSEGGEVDRKQRHGSADIGGEHMKTDTVGAEVDESALADPIGSPRMPRQRGSEVAGEALADTYMAPRFANGANPANDVLVQVADGRSSARSLTDANNTETIEGEGEPGVTATKLEERGDSVRPIAEILGTLDAGLLRSVNVVEAESVSATPVRKSVEGVRRDTCKQTGQTHPDPGAAQKQAHNTQQQRHAYLRDGNRPAAPCSRGRRENQAAFSHGKESRAASAEGLRRAQTRSARSQTPRVRLRASRRLKVLQLLRTAPRLEEALLSISWYEATLCGTDARLEAIAMYEDVFRALRVKLRVRSPSIEDVAIDDFLLTFLDGPGRVQTRFLLQSVYGVHAGAETLRHQDVQAARVWNVHNPAAGAEALKGAAVDARSDGCPLRSTSASMWTVPCLAALRCFLLSRELNWVLAWRRVLDIESRGRLPQQAFYRALQRVGYRHHLRSAWCQLDAGSHGYITLAELDWDTATTLGTLHSAFVSTYGSAARAVRQVNGDDRRSISVASFRNLLGRLTVASRVNALSAILVTEDEPGVVTVESLRWLDKIGFSLPLPPLLRAVPGFS